MRDPAEGGAQINKDDGRKFEVKGVCIYDARNVHGGCEAENKLFSASQNLNNSKLFKCLIRVY